MDIDKCVDCGAVTYGPGHNCEPNDEDPGDFSGATEGDR